MLYRDLFVQMGFHVGNRIGKGRVKGLGNKGNAVFWTAVQIIAEQIQNSLFGLQRRKDIILSDAVDEIEEKLFGLFRIFRIDAERQMNEFEQVGLLAGDLEMAIVGAVWIMDIGKKRLVRVGGKQVQLSACRMDGCLIDADGSLPLQDELNAGKGRNRGITFPRFVTDDEVGALQTDGRFAQAVLDNQICFVHGCLSCCSG